VGAETGSRSEKPRTAKTKKMGFKRVNWLWLGENRASSSENTWALCVFVLEKFIGNRMG